jgi:hypothetical protein
MKGRTHVQEVKGFKFPTEVISVRVGDSIRYRICTQETSSYSSLYQHDSRFFVLYIEEVNRESPQLFNGDTFEYRFVEPGIYSVMCLNYPKLRQTVTVEAEGTHVPEEGLPILDDLSDISQIDSEASSSTVRQESIFRQSECNSRYFSNQKEDGRARVEATQSLKGVFGNNFNSISSCIELIATGATRESIIDQFPDILDPLDGRSGQRRDSPRPNGPSDDNLVSRKSTPFFDDTPYLQLKNAVKTENSLDIFGKISEVHRINQMSPDNLFQIFTRLKSELATPQDSLSDTQSVYSSIDDLQSDVTSDIDFKSIDPILPKGHKPRRLKRTNAQMDARFS